MPVIVPVADGRERRRQSKCLAPPSQGHDLPGIRLEVAARRPGANLNALLVENLRDPLSGNAVLSGVPVRLERETPDQERM